jgi:Protein of unknown function with HXXEE motif
MNFVLLTWLFALAVTLHNAEEGWFLPAWSRSAGRWHPPVGTGEFRFAAGILTVLAYLAAGLSASGGKGSVGAYLLAGYALAMLLNVVFPHVLATIAERRYAPGTATAVLLNLPITVLLLSTAIQAGYIQLAAFLWVGPLVTGGLLGALPLLFALGRWLLNPRKSSSPRAQPGARPGNRSPSLSEDDHACRN